jgi:hypothetical protein
MSFKEFKELIELSATASSKIEARHYFKEIQEFVDAAHNAGLLFVENAPANFSLTSRGPRPDVREGFTYLDIEPAWQHNEGDRIDISKLRSMTERLPDEIRGKIEHSIQQIETLRKQKQAV